MADTFRNQPKAHYEVKLYAHDEEMIRLFSFMQFGIQCEEGICSTELEIHKEKTHFIKEITKVEPKERWDKVWPLLKALMEHLRKSPVFYPGEEFTEDVYKEFFLDENTRVFVAEENDQIIGVMEANKGGNSFVTNGEDSYNVGDIFVLEEYRGDKVAQQLLQYVSDTVKKEGARQLWVEHGTANPNARGFWNKYFDSYAYTMIRDIKLC